MLDEILDRYLAEILRVAPTHGARTVRVFGSLALTEPLTVPRRGRRVTWLPKLVMD